MHVRSLAAQTLMLAATPVCEDLVRALNDEVLVQNKSQPINEYMIENVNQFMTLIANSQTIY